VNHLSLSPIFFAVCSLKLVHFTYGIGQINFECEMVRFFCTVGGKTLKTFLGWNDFLYKQHLPKNVFEKSVTFLNKKLIHFVSGFNFFSRVLFCSQASFGHWSYSRHWNSLRGLRQGSQTWRREEGLDPTICRCLRFQTFPLRASSDRTKWVFVWLVDKWHFYILTLTFHSGPSQEVRGPRLRSLTGPLRICMNDYKYQGEIWILA